MTYSESLDYADFALRQSMEFGGHNVSWLQSRDLQTRGKFATYIRRGCPGTEALRVALQETYLDWRTRASAPESPVKSSKRSRDVKEEPSSDEQPRKRAKSSAAAVKLRTVSTLPGGKNMCKPWVDGRGCPKGSSCPNAHQCDLLLPNGKPCGGKHTRANHCD